MHLIWATEDFKLLGRPMPDFPIIRWEDWTSCHEANRFLRYYLTRGSIGSKNSWPSTGRAMYDFFSFLEAHGLAWTDVDRGEDKNLVAAYRDYCFDQPKLSLDTVRQRLLYICKFYEYAQRKGWILILPFSYEERRTYGSASGFLGHVSAHNNVKVADVMPRSKKTLPKFLTLSEITALTRAAKNKHHRIIIRMALQSGLRREELATFPLQYVKNQNSMTGSGRNVCITLDPRDGSGMKTKGSVERKIWISRRLMQDLHFYAVHIRGERASLSVDQQQPLFLNQKGKPWSAHGKGIETMVRKLGRTISVQAHPHMLRHTYATHTLSNMQNNPKENRIEPLVYIQKQLGHASIKTTMIYLHLINERADDAVLRYDDELNDLWDEETK